MTCIITAVKKRLKKSKSEASLKTELPSTPPENSPLIQSQSETVLQTDQSQEALQVQDHVETAPMGRRAKRLSQMSLNTMVNVKDR